ncbi:MAG TPA: MFS transporter [Streptosporangiaceae bacterium]|nr:MFS transporter [Streptosporangiaceae bacterium]
MADQLAHVDIAPEQETGHPARGRLALFATVSIALFMASVDQTIVATALPAIQHDLHAQVNWSAWTITVYALGQVLVMPLAGKFGDQYGRKKIFLGAVALFTAASLCCGLADNIYLLIVLRFIQALGGGALMPSATGIIAERFGAGRDRALGLFSSIFPIGGIVGPVLGGVFVTYWSWRGIFLVNIPVGLVLLAFGAVVIPQIPHRRDPQLDIIGVLLLGATLLAAMLGIGYLGGNHSNPLSVFFLLPECIAVLAAIAFIRHTARAPSPFVSLRFLTGRGFGVMNVLNFLYGSAVLGFAPLVPLYAETRFRLAALPAGTLLTARAVGMIAVAAASVWLLRRTGYRWPMAVGFVLCGVGLVATASTPHALSAYAWLALGTGVCGVGMGIATPAANNATLQLAPEQAAAVAGLRGMFRQAGAITAVSITAAIVARSADPGIAQAHTFLVFAAIIIASLPLVLLVPDHRGRW